MQAHAKEMPEYRNRVLGMHSHPSFFFILDAKPKRQYLLKQQGQWFSHDDLFDSFGM
jgi:hypothetical protein